MKPPRIRGAALRAARIAAETPGTDAVIRQVMVKGLGVDQLARLPMSMRAELPLDAKPVAARPPRALPAEAAPPPPASWPRASAAFAAAYASKTATPRAVADRAIAALDELASRRPSMNLLVAHDPAITRADADASAARYAAGKPVGPLDGAPLLVKDEFDVAGFVTSLGSACTADVRATRDSTMVERLRAAGMIFLGKTVLTEWGMSPIGGNVNQKMPHNAHDPTRAPGGSSTGSAVGVALGLAPVATAGDGGGSIRIPASLNGVFGIKPTFGRVSRAGDGFKGSVAHAGPIAASAWDLAHALDACAATHDPLDDLTAWAPAPPPGGFGGRLGAGVRGRTFGVDEAAWAEAAPGVAKACRGALAALEKEGAKLVDVKMPLAAHAARIGYLTIAPESLASNLEAWTTQRERIADDVRLVFAVVAGFTALDQLDAQRLRAGLRLEAARVLGDVDFLALPTTAVTAPIYGEDDERVSFSDPAAIEGLCRYAFLGNLTGLPAGTAPVGADELGLPVGLQIVGDAWDEAGVIGVLGHLERIEAARARRPPSAIDLLPR
ncbi:MAG TPA: amidase [Byssovorax sp.]|jgi:aspartyl-tRNA(Asn)/glutamyl-tRNA(Gln) amidotransferase subunit A